MSFNRSGKWFSWLPGVLVAAVFAAGGVAVAVGGDGEGGVVTVDPVRAIDASLVSSEVRLAVDDADLSGIVPGEGVSALMLNVKVFTPAASGYLAVFPCDAVTDRVSSLTLNAGVTVQGSVTSKVSAATPGEVCIEARTSDHSPMDVSRMIVYVTGYVYTQSLDSTVAALTCTTDQIAIFDGTDWGCKTAEIERSVKAVRNATLESIDSVGRNPSMAIGHDGNPVIAHQFGTNSGLKLYVCTAADCSTGANVTL